MPFDHPDSTSVAFAVFDHPATTAAGFTTVDRTDATPAGLVTIDTLLPHWLHYYWPSCCSIVLAMVVPAGRPTTVQPAAGFTTVDDPVGTAVAQTTVETALLGFECLHGACPACVRTPAILELPATYL